MFVCCLKDCCGSLLVGLFGLVIWLLFVALLLL